MKNLLVILMLTLSFMLNAQKPVALPLANKEWTTVEKALQIPIGFEMYYAEVVVYSKSLNNIFKYAYTIAGIKPDKSTESKRLSYIEFWDRVLKQAVKGDEVSFEVVWVKKGDEKTKLAPKAFFLP